MALKKPGMGGMGGGALHMGAGGSTLLLPTGAGNGLFCLVGLTEIDIW